MKRVLGLFMAAVVATSSPLVFAQTQSGKPIRIVTSDGPGGVIDITVRALADKLSASLGQPILIENKPGASGIIASDTVAKAPPDGLTFLATAAFSQVVVPSTFQGKLPYNPDKDLEPVTLLAGAPFVFLVSDKSPAKNIGDLTSIAKQKGAKFTAGTSGPATLLHLTFERFKKDAKLDEAYYVPFKTGSQATQGLAMDEVDVVVEPLAPALSLIRAGKIRPIAITAPKRSPLAPEIPTLVESGYPNLVTFGWLAILAPTGTPADLSAKMTKAVASAMRQSDVQERLKTLALSPLPTGPEELKTIITNERKIYSTLVDQLGLKQSTVK